MAEIASDKKWKYREEIKVLTLEHHVAVRRGGFDGFFEPLHKIGNFKTGLLDGTLSGIFFFARQVLPLVEAMKSEDKFMLTRIVKDHSPIIASEKRTGNANPSREIRKARISMESVLSLWSNGADPILLDVLKAIEHEGLFTIPDVFAPVLSSTDRPEKEQESAHADAEDKKNSEIDAWHEALSVPFNQFERYAKYIFDKSPFGTHEGIKGQQFPRVMIILDDNEARGFMFSYEKLFKAKALTETDEKNRLEGRDMSLDRTRRLFYVTCSRAQYSLAIIAYMKEADKAASHVSDADWFSDQEVVRM